MAHLQYPTSASVNPPLFLSKEKLLELDKIIADHLPQIEAENERYIEADFEKYYGSSVGASPEKAKKYLEERRQERKISLTLHFKNGTELHANSFREAARHTEINSAPAEGFALSIAHSPVQVNIRTSDRKSEMTISASPSDSPVVTGLFGDLRNWAQTVAPKPWQRAWVSTGHMLDMFVWMAWVVVALLVFLPSKQDESKLYFQSQARELLKSGVNASNEKKALEILLAMESGYEAPPSSSPPISRRSIALVIGVFFSCLIFSFPPRSVLGIGRGEKLLARWNRWLKFISVSVPGYLASIYLWPKIYIRA
jgi:hypothetical protein